MKSLLQLQLVPLNWLATGLSSRSQVNLIYRRIPSSSSEQRVLAKQWRKLARIFMEAMAARVVALEAEIGAHRAASNIGSVARLEDAESDGWSSAAPAEAGDNVHVCPLPVFIGAESLSSARAEAPPVIVDRVEG